MTARALVIVVALLVTAPIALSAAAAPMRTSGPQPIYAAFSLLKQGKPTTRRCGTYRITRGTYTGRSASPDPRLAGRVTYTGRIALSSGSTSGVASGTMTLRDSRNRIRMRANVSGVVTQSTTVNGLVTGSLMRPSALLLANVTIVFDEELGFAAVRLGLENGANSGVAYPAIPNC
jgi:hypothetical protein